MNKKIYAEYIESKDSCILLMNGYFMGQFSNKEKAEQRFKELTKKLKNDRRTGF